MRRALAPAVVLLGLVLAPSAAAASFQTFVTDKNPAKFDTLARFTAEVVNDDGSPAAGAAIELVGPAGTAVASGATDASGGFTASVRIRKPGEFFARAVVGTEQIESGRIAMRVIPRIRYRIYGTRMVGAKLVLRGHVSPAAAGRSYLRMWGDTRRLRRTSAGWFRKELSTRTVAVLRGTVKLEARPGYTRADRSFAISLRRPSLAYGSRSVAVRALERRLRDLHYVLRDVDTNFTLSTYQAVVAFQKVHRMARTGRVGSGFWRALTSAHVPHARIASGAHIEVDKTRQVMFEVVRGKVTRVVHVSTGATGNTPVGSWHVYRLGPGGSLSGMYYSLYFLRGFAIHGYHSVPNYPASHGCVRTPLWFAPGFYSRWGRIGTRVVVFP